MPFCIVHGDVLDAVADGLLLTIDGARKSMEGNVARTYARRWPDAFEEIEYEIPYPLPLGRTVATHRESPFSFVLIASTLNHIDVLTDSQKSRIVGSALREAIAIAQRSGIQRLVTPVMTGGWRVSFSSALDVMLAVARPLSHMDSGLTLEIHIRDERDFQSAVRQAEKTGISIRFA